MDSLDNMVSEVFAKDANNKVEAVEVADVKEETADVGVSEDNVSQENNEDEGNESDGYVEFPRKAKNAISNRDKKIAKLQYQLRELQNAMSNQVKAVPAVDNKPAPPKEDDFETYGDYLEARVLYNIENKNKAKEEKPAESSEVQLSPQMQAWVAERESYIENKSKEYSTKISDWDNVYQDNLEFIDLIDKVPQYLHIRHAFYEADDGALAFYNMAKSGKLGELFQMTPNKVAMMIAKHENMPNQPKIQPPRPINGVSGVGKPSKSLSNMSPNELAGKFLNKGY